MGILQETIKNIEDAVEKIRKIRTEPKLTPEDLPENIDKTFLVEQDLHELGVILSRLSLRGVSKDIIADTMINSLNYQSINEITSRFDSFLRAIKQ